jgi:hypothetical protein
VNVDSYAEKGGPRGTKSSLCHDKGARCLAKSRSPVAIRDSSAKKCSCSTAMDRSYEKKTPVQENNSQGTRRKPKANDPKYSATAAKQRPFSLNYRNGRRKETRLARSLRALGKRPAVHKISATYNGKSLVERCLCRLPRGRGGIHNWKPDLTLPRST